MKGDYPEKLRLSMYFFVQTGNVVIVNSTHLKDTKTLDRRCAFLRNWIFSDSIR